MIDYPQNPKEGTKAFDAFCKLPLKQERVFGNLISINSIHSLIKYDNNMDVVDADILSCSLYSESPKYEPWLYIHRLRFQVGAYERHVSCCDAIAFCGNEIKALECILRNFNTHSNILTPQNESSQINALCVWTK